MSIRNFLRAPALLACAMLAAGSVSVAAGQRYSSADARISGTYELESTRGDNPQRAADEATRGLRGSERDRVYRGLLVRLEPPSTLSIDRRGRMVAIASSIGPRAAFEADGRDHDERGPGGQTITTRAEFKGDQLVVSTSGNRGSDFEVTFESFDNGERLKVTRRFDSDDLGRAVKVTSYYRRTADDPRWDLFAGRSDFRGPSGGDFVVPDGTRMIATLDTPLSTRSSRNGEPFTMTVRSPREFEGARIDGVISQVNPYSSSRRRVDMRVNFESIRLRGGRTGEFRALLTSVRTPDGNTVRVDAEGGVRDAGGGAEEKIEQGAIGAAIGAVIGAIAGGGKGAAVGAIVGGAGGAILAEGRDQLDLDRGTEISMIATAPRYRISDRDR